MNDTNSKISDLQAGDTLCRAEFALTRADVDKYSALMGDDCDYGENVPPMIPHGKALGAIVERFKECAGAVHFTEEAQILNFPQVNDKITFEAQVSSIRKRAAQLILTIDLNFTNTQAQKILKSKSVIILNE